MAENLMRRVGRIISGAAHHIVNCAEDAAPEVVMEQAIREVETAIDDVKVARGRAISARRLAESRLEEENARHEELKEQCEVAITAGKRNLAETGMGRMLDIEAQIPVLEAEMREAEKERAEIEGYLAALNGRKSEMIEDLRRLRDAQAQAGAAGGTDPGSGSGPTRRADQARDAFDNAMERATGLRRGQAAVSASDARDLQQLEEAEAPAQN